MYLTRMSMYLLRPSELMSMYLTRNGIWPVSVGGMQGLLSLWITFWLSLGLPPLIHYEPVTEASAQPQNSSQRQVHDTRPVGTPCRGSERMPSARSLIGAWQDDDGGKMMMVAR